MDFKRCQICDKLFASNGGLVCSDCLDRLDEVYQKARTAIRDHRRERISVESLAEMIEEDEKYIEILVKDGRIRLASVEESVHACPMCGAPLRLGEKYCDRCKASLVNGLSGDSKGKDKKYTMFSQERRKR